MTSPYVLTQLRSLHAALRQRTQAMNAGLYCAQELLTTIGLMRVLTPGPEQLAAELQVQTEFPDLRILPPLSSGPTSAVHPRLRDYTIDMAFWRFSFSFPRSGASSTRDRSCSRLPAVLVLDEVSPSSISPVILRSFSPTDLYGVFP